MTIMASHVTSQNHKGGRSGWGVEGEVEKYRNIYVGTFINTKMTRVPPIAPMQGCSGYSRFAPSFSLFFPPGAQNAESDRWRGGEQMESVGCASFSQR